MSASSIASDLCTQCGLCCNGALFDFGPLTAEEVPQAQDNGLAVLAEAGKFGFAQPCPALDGAHCRIYAARPDTCRTFRCKVLRAVEAEDMTIGEAQSIIARTVAAANEARAQLPPGASFTEARRWRREAGAAHTLNAPPQLMVALGMLDLLLDQYFRKTSERQILPRE